MNSVGNNVSGPTADLSAGSRWTRAQRAALGAIRAYQLLLSPWIGRQCRFYPSCSHYAHQAIEVHGVSKGVRLSAARLGKCHPFHPGGVDLVPEPARQPQTEHS